jgi:plasmid stabilization system protein ParE
MRFVWTRPALRHLDEIQDYIAQDSPAAAYEVAYSITTRAEDGLSHVPFMGRHGRASDTRELVFADLPYIVVYRITTQVEILAVIHTARDWPEGFD